MTYTVQHIQAHMDSTLIFTAPTGTYDDKTKKLTVPNAVWNGANQSTTRKNQIDGKIKVKVAINGAPVPAQQPQSHTGVVIGAGARGPGFPRNMKLHATSGGTGVDLIDA